MLLRISLASKRQSVCVGLLLAWRSFCFATNRADLRPLCSTARRGLICARPVLLCRAPHRDEPYLDSLIQCAADPSQHCQGMAFVIRVFKAADDRCRGTDELGKLRLSEACRCAQCVDFAGDLFVRPRLFKLLQPTR